MMRRMCLAPLFCKLFFFKLQLVGFFFLRFDTKPFVLLVDRQIVTQGVTSSLTTVMKAQMKCHRFPYLFFIFFFDCLRHKCNKVAFLSQVEPSKRPVVNTMDSTDSERPPLIAHYLYIQVSLHVVLCSYH